MPLEPSAASTSPAPSGQEIRAWIDRCLAGDQEARALLIGLLQTIPAMARSLNRALTCPLDEEDLRDAIQEAAAALWSKLDRYSPGHEFQGWVYGFCSMQLRKAIEARIRRRRVPLLGDDDLDAEGADTGIDLAEDYALVHAALEHLPEVPARVVRLKVFDDLTFEQIAARLQISSNTAKTHYYRALKRLGALLGSHVSQGGLE
jgi:RNA polymerase sigma-70 factor, ECF subfamily